MGKARKQPKRWRKNPENKRAIKKLIKKNIEVLQSLFKK
jgi:hypothetical protein